MHSFQGITPNHSSSWLPDQKTRLYNTPVYKKRTRSNVATWYLDLTTGNNYSDYPESFFPTMVPGSPLPEYTLPGSRVHSFIPGYDSRMQKILGPDRDSRIHPPGYPYAWLPETNQTPYVVPGWNPDTRLLQFPVTKTPDPTFFWLHKSRIPTTSLMFPSTPPYRDSRLPRYSLFPDPKNIPPNSFFLVVETYDRARYFPFFFFLPSDKQTHPDPDINLSPFQKKKKK